MSAQEQVRKMLINDFAFQPISTKSTGFGERQLLRSEKGLEAQLGVYRVCFYACQKIQSEAVDTSSFPRLRQPSCFDTDQKLEIKTFLEKSLGIQVKIKKRVAKTKESVPTLFEI